MGLLLPRYIQASKIIVQDTPVNVMAVDDKDYISLTDMMKAKDGDFFISDWLRNRNTVEFLGAWEQIQNPDFNYGEFAVIKSQAGLNSYKISIPPALTARETAIVYASEADVLNVALFGMTAQKWRNRHPKLNGNMRDYADISQLVCLSNLENLNAVFISDGLSQTERLKRLNAVAIKQQHLIDTFVNAIYIFDDRIVFTLNYKDDAKTVTLMDIESSDLSISGVQTSNQKLYHSLIILSIILVKQFDEQEFAKDRYGLYNTRRIWMNKKPELPREKLNRKGAENLTIEDVKSITGIGDAKATVVFAPAGDDFISGILMFGYEYEIIKEFSNFFLDYQEHDNDSTRWTDRIVSNTGEWSGNIFDFYTRAYARIAQAIKTPFKLVGDTRIDDTPMHTALREALVNALIHADHYGRRGLVIHVRPENITIANPGSLRLSLDDIIVGGVSDPRNTILIKLFNLLNIGERAGSGVPNIYAVWKNQDLPLLVLQEQFNPDRTILSLVLKKTSDKKQAIKPSDKTATKKSDTRKKSIVDYLTNHESSSAADLAEFVGISPARVRVYMQELIAENVVTADGANRNRVYMLKSNAQS